MHIARLQATTMNEESASEEELSEEEQEKVVPKSHGMKRKADDSSEEPSAKKQRVMESPRLPGPKVNFEAIEDNSEVMSMLDQLATNSRVNFANLRTYIRDKFEEARTQNDELKLQMRNLEDKLDVVIKELRTSRMHTANSSSPPKVQSNGEYIPARRQSNEPAKQQLSYYNFL